MTREELKIKIADVIADNVFVKYGKTSFTTSEEIIALLLEAGWKAPGSPDPEKEALKAEIIKKNTLLRDALENPGEDRSLANIEEELGLIWDIERRKHVSQDSISYIAKEGGYDLLRAEDYSPEAWEALRRKEEEKRRGNNYELESRR